MPTLIQTNLPTILQAVEQQLLNYYSQITSSTVVHDLTNIYWIFPEEEPIPSQTGQRDVLLALHPDKLVNIEGDGRFAKILSGFDVYLRSSNASDRRSTKRDWMIAHRTLIDALNDALMGFFPEDDGGDALTIEGLVLDTNATPAKNRDSKTWGQTVGTYKFHYLPKLDTTVLQ